MGIFTFALSWFAYAIIASSILGWCILLTKFIIDAFYFSCRFFGLIENRSQENIISINKYKNVA